MRRESRQAPPSRRRPTHTRPQHPHPRSSRGCVTRASLPGTSEPPRMDGLPGPEQGPSSKHNPPPDLRDGRCSWILQELYNPSGLHLLPAPPDPFLFSIPCFKTGQTPPFLPRLLSLRTDPPLWPSFLLCSFRGTGLRASTRPGSSFHWRAHPGPVRSVGRHPGCHPPPTQGVLAASHFWARTASCRLPG